MAKRGLRRWIGVLGFAFVALAALSYTLLAGNAPVLGLDLQGGVSVVLQPKGDPPSDAIDQAISVVRNRVDALGVAEPEIARQGDTILVQIPGVEDRDRALELVGQTAQLRFRPVCAVGGPPTEADATTDSTTAVDPEATTDSTITVDPGATTDTPSGDEQGLGLAGAGSGELALGAQTSDTVTDSTLPTTDTSAAADPNAADPNAADPNATTDPTAVADPTVDPGLDPSALTTQQNSGDGCAGTGAPAPLSPDVCTAGVPDEADLPDQAVLLPQCDPDSGEVVAQYLLGPTLLSGDSLEGANAGLGQGGQWIVNPTFKDGADGIGKFNTAAAQCNAKAATCPTGQLAVVLDGEVISAPAIEQAQFSRDQIQISGSFTEKSARNLSTVLKYGALPVEFEQQQVQIVSATLGEDALRAGLWSGLVGFVLVAGYMIAFYRLLGVLAVAKLLVEGALLWSIIALLGETQGLALTLAGITGLIVSVGVSVDSNVVYYEHMREQVRDGRSVRSATDKAFSSSWSTIVKADVASLIGAGLLWWLTVGPVRGFAFFLGLAGVLDLLAAYFFMQPVVRRTMYSQFATDHPKAFGLPKARVDGTDSADGTDAVPPRFTPDAKEVLS